MAEQREQELDQLFRAAQDAFPEELDPSPEFLAGVWARIEASRPTDWLAVIERWSPRIAVAGVAAAAIMSSALWFPNHAAQHAAVVDKSYIEALTVDSLDEHDGAMWILAGSAKHHQQ
ncbi:MAG: hypothetical protein GC160_18240 [Acidobacteria bacterium]|nr:hypothetical protein [Acidobacteriota bacterium]